MFYDVKSVQNIKRNECHTENAIDNIKVSLSLNQKEKYKMKTESMM